VERKLSMSSVEKIDGYKLNLGLKLITKTNC
jgi:hypothetical protein